MSPRQIVPARRRPARAVVHRQAVRQTIEGSEKAVRARLIELLRAGELVEAGRFHKVGSRWVVSVVAFPPEDQPRRVRRTAWIAGAVTAVLAALMVAVVQVVGWLAAHVAQIAAGAVLLLLLGFAVTRLNHSGACPGLHCSGCKGGHS